DDTYLFSVKLKPNQVNHTFFIFEVSIWVLTMLSLCFLVQNICNYLSGKNYPLTSLLVLAVFITSIRFIHLYFGWPEFSYTLNIFKSKLDPSSAIFPSFGDFCINICLTLWFITFLYTRRNQIFKAISNKIISYLVLIAGILILIITSTFLVNLFYGLIIHSKINFDVNNVLNLSFFSIIGVLMLAIAFLVFYLLDEVFLTVCFKLS